MLSVGVSYPAINVFDLGNILISLPSFKEQQAISNFLDCETSQLDKLIAAKERLLVLLVEKRRALITQAVTRGLDPDVEMRVSGIEWLGEVPAHWQVRKLKYLVSFYGGGTPSKENEQYWQGNIPWVSPKDMKSRFIIDTEDHISEEALAYSSTRLIKENAVLVVVRSGILRHSIPTAVNIVPVTINQDMKAFIPYSTLTSLYLNYAIEGLQDFLLAEWRKEGTTVESLEQEYISNTKLIVPPIFEQENIVSFLDKELEKLDALKAATERTISLLKERRTLLIAAAVAGQIAIEE